MLFLKEFQSIVKSDIYKQGLGKDNKYFYYMHAIRHGLRTPREEKAFTARPNIQSQSQIFKYG